MPKVWSNTKHRLAISSMEGSSIVELLLAATLFGFMTVALIGALVYGRQSTNEAGNRTRALLLAEEGLEAVRNIRDNTYANLTNGTFGLTQSSNQWVLSGSTDTNGIFTRQITIAAGSTSSRKLITAQVSWAQAVGSGIVQVTTEVTNWMAALVRSWSNGGSFIASLDLTGTNNGLHVATQGNYAYVARADGTPDFMIIDISTPSNPTVVGSLSVSGTINDLTVSGNYAYLATTDDAAELRIVNIATPTAPSLAGLFNGAGTSDARGVFYSGGFAYLARAANASNNEFLKINVTNPALTSRSSYYSMNVNMNDVYVNGNDIYIVTDTDNAEIIRISSALLGLITSSITMDLAGTENATTVAGNSATLYVAHGSNMRIINGTQLAQSSAIAPASSINDLDINGTAYAYTAGSSSSFEFSAFNIASSTAPALIANTNAGFCGLNGLSYSTTKDVVVGVGANDLAEVIIYGPN